MITGTNWQSTTWRILTTAFLLIVAACNSPLDIDTPRRLTRINLDSLVATDSFIRAPGDSIFAYIDNQEVVFATEVARPVFYNRYVDGRYYVTVQATSSDGLSGSSYEIMSLRLDGIRDTGTYIVNASYSVPKQIDTVAAPSYGALYQRKTSGGSPESYRTGVPESSGIIHVLRIDELHDVMTGELRDVMTGTFEFRGYYTEGDTAITVNRGAFRLYLTK